MEPFVKWAGGKRQLISELKKDFPEQFNCYYEPFLGGGAVFFSLAPKTAVISDMNKQLMGVYGQLKKDSAAVVLALRNLNKKTITSQYYMTLRDKYNTHADVDTPEQAALFIWLNKHCFNGVYRVNKDGKFNVPFNKNSTKVIDPCGLLEVGRYLQTYDIAIKNCSYKESCADAGKGDFVYIDPPYIPVKKTSFTSYTYPVFGESEHVELAAFVKELVGRGTYVIVSSSDTPLARSLYDGFRIREVEARRSVNSDGNDRRGVELIITPC